MAGRLLSLGPCSAHRGVLTGQNAVPPTDHLTTPVARHGAHAPTRNLLRPRVVGPNYILLISANRARKGSNEVWCVARHPIRHRLLMRPRDAFVPPPLTTPLGKHQKITTLWMNVVKGNTTLSHFVVLVRLQPFFL